MRTASIDVGTNTIRLLVCELSDNGQLKQLYLDRVITRLGEGFSEQSRLLTKNAVSRSLEALITFSRIIKEYNVDKYRAVATSVVRESVNGSEFVNKVKNHTGLTIEVISGEEEAKLTVLGVLNSIEVNTKHSIIFDIGGGSTEYVYIQDTEILSLTSTNLGVVHLTEEFLIKETKAEMADLSNFVQATLKQSLKDFKIENYNKLSLVGTAGTPTTLAAMDMGLKKYNSELVNNYILTKSRITTILGELINIPKIDRINLPGLEKGREDIIITGIIILLETLKYFSSNKVIVSDGGVLEGIARSITS
jgi:exopolyphosphatase/guanosine-5'-triphosphate,3'-diphosphate pyrophosphatase